MNRFDVNKISRSDFLKLNENDLMFITNPGRMGDEDGTTFIIKHNNEFSIYRVEGWMYPIEGEIINISFDDTKKQFPKWVDAWKHGGEKNYKGKYKYLYMGFGNGLSIDNSIYKEFEPYLNNLVEKYLKDSNADDKYVAIYSVWENAFIDMVDDKGYVLRK